ncbi:hypothetical protein KM176_04180 [Pseudooceanicola sp. CBS1P-1]|uniref:DUF3035 domain-containing protein n=1 Tax=Pseudooceanicola albus TaxID=2692189 RepID=A0A6L7G6R5_9RHOB|nr:MULTISPECIES: hypothetical protein [Pseudooceanicola]MBT9383049.1 hypothetical protein [Pseudooceanicola endophyticus]MXN19237.1 hypothetical protein [Pseudooceanicola albus]
MTAVSAPRARRCLLPALLLLGLAACGTPSSFDNPNLTLDAATPYPDLVPEGQILARADAPTRIAEQDDQALLARAARLKARAAALRATEVAG